MFDLGVMSLSYLSFVLPGHPERAFCQLLWGLFIWIAQLRHTQLLI
jgi:hypothetical protein